MVTGDAQETAVAIAKLLSIYRPGSTCISGDAMEAMSDRELLAHIDNVSVFYRVTPRQKLRIVQAYQVRSTLHHILPTFEITTSTLNIGSRCIPEIHTT